MMYLIKNGQACGEIYISSTANKVIQNAADSFALSVKELCGAELSIHRFSENSLPIKGVVFATFEEVNRVGFEFQEEKTRCKEDGFFVKRYKDCIFVLAHREREVYYGAHDLLEKNAEVIYSRGTEGERFACIPTVDLRLEKTDYTESSPFAIRTWNLCGIGSDGRDHSDLGTVRYLSENKTNGVSHCIENEWRDYGLKGCGVGIHGVANLDDLIEEHPEYFMVAPDGKPMPAHCGWESFLNYYNKGAALELAHRIINGLKTSNPEDVVIWIMPDNPYFCMVEDGKRLHEMPFCADDGTVVDPSHRSYKSTVYFNFLNRVIAEVNRVIPNTYLQVFAYTYSEEAPLIAVDEHLIVTLAPILTNERYSYVDTEHHDNAAIAENILRWSKKANHLALYTYWHSFQGTIYSRPILRTVQENLLWFEKLGVYQIEIEGKVDCSFQEDWQDSQQNARLFYDMNEFYVWAINKLLWNPREDLQSLTARYCRIVYKECASEMEQYFSLLQEGWEKQDGLVWYTTGGDVYYLQFVILAGIADRLQETLSAARDKAKTPTVKRKVDAICEAVFKEIEKYKNFVKESAEVTYSPIKQEELLSSKQMNYVNNPESVWNKAKPLTVLRDYNTMEFYPKEAKFSCRMMYDDENLYIGYTTFDDSIEKTLDSNGYVKIIRKDGKEAEIYAETYIGGNIFNQSVYYGYLSGWNGSTIKEEFYETRGSPIGIPVPEGVRDVKFIHLDVNPEKRYCFHVQVIPFTALNADKNTITPYGSFVYYSDRYGRAGWMGYGLWSKSNFSEFKLKEKK